MSEIEAQTASETTVEAPEIDPIEIIHKGQCQSLSGRSTLELAIGRHSNDGTLWLAITGNSGGGMWCRDPVSASAIQDVVLGADGLTAKSFHCLHPGKSINTAGFVMAALREIGLVRTNAENRRLHSHVPGMTFEKAVAAYFSSHEVASTKKPKRPKEV